ncbi:GntR family transcriptional regulator [Streptomyces sp. NPDC058861]|uniref:GntR family transcriptional regulator n=1 Tax=Streptomyces sp. NPDC058861 TaxID=3346653 RepID=UPI0036CD7629
MTAKTAPGLQDAGLAGTPTYSELRSVLAAVYRVGRAYDGTDRGHSEEVLRLVEPWLPVAKDRMKAAGSPADQDRWQDLVDEVESRDNYGDAAARGLLRALMEASRPGPSVREIAERLHAEIADGTRPPGSVLSRRRIRADVGLAPASESRVDLALQDLAAGGLVTVDPSNMARVVDQERPPRDQLDLAADVLRVLISSGVYPRLSPLPKREELAQVLATKRPIVGQVLRRLHDEEILSVYPGVGVVVRPVLPFPVNTPPALENLADRLRRAAPSGTDLDHAGIRKSCQQARSWWHLRSAPTSESLRRARQILVAAAADLLPLIARRHPDDPVVHAVLRRTAVVALHDWPAQRDIEVWRAACLATAVLDVLTLADGAA